MLDNNPAATSIVADGVSLYQLRKDGSIWKYVTSVLSGWQVLDSNPATVAITAGGGYLYQRPTMAPSGCTSPIPHPASRAVRVDQKKLNASS